MLNTMWLFKNRFEKISKNILETTKYTRQTKYQYIYLYFYFVWRLFLKEIPLHKVYTLKSKHKETETFSYNMIIISHNNKQWCGNRVGCAARLDEPFDRKFLLPKPSIDAHNIMEVYIGTLKIGPSAAQLTQSAGFRGLCRGRADDGRQDQRRHSELLRLGA